MKLKKLIKLLFFILIVNVAQSQTVWAPDGAVWYYDYVNYIGTGYTKLEYSRDTVINDINCKILEKTRYFFDYSNSQYYTFSLGQEYTYSENNIVYYYRFGNFYVLYDFAANSQDTWEIVTTEVSYEYCDSICNVLVDSSNVFNHNEFNLKRLYVSCNDTSDWLLCGQIIERIGASSYMFPNNNNCIIDGGSEFNLRCYFDNEFGYYKTTSNECDSIITSIENIDIDDPLRDSYIYPNILQSFELVNIKSKNYINEIKIFDVQGKVLYENLINSKDFSLNLNFLKNGLYLIKFNNTTHKILISR